MTKSPHQQPFIDGLGRLKRLENREGLQIVDVGQEGVSPRSPAAGELPLVQSNIIAGLASSSVMPDGRKKKQLNTEMANTTSKKDQDNFRSISRSR